MSAYPYKFKMMSETQLEEEYLAADKQVKYWTRRRDTIYKIAQLSAKRRAQKDDYYTPDDLREADRIEQQAAELEFAADKEKDHEKAFNKVKWFLGEGYNFPHFLTRAWRNEALQDFTKRRHVDELYDKYREVVKSYVANGQMQMAEEMVGDFLFLLNQIVRARRAAPSWRNY